MIIGLASDHAGYPLKAHIYQFLKESLCNGLYKI